MNECGCAIVSCSQDTITSNMVFKIKKICLTTIIYKTNLLTAFKISIKSIKIIWTLFSYSSFTKKIFHLKNHFLTKFNAWKNLKKIWKVKNLITWWIKIRDDNNNDGWTLYLIFFNIKHFFYSSSARKKRIFFINFHRIFYYDKQHKLHENEAQRVDFYSEWCE